MAITSINAPSDAAAISTWSFAIGDTTVPVVRVSGFDRGVSGTIEVPSDDARIFPFSDQVKTAGDITITIIENPLDTKTRFFSDLVDDVEKNGTRVSGTLIKYHHGKKYYKVEIDTALCHRETLPDLEKGGSGPHETTYIMRTSGIKRTFFIPPE